MNEWANEPSSHHQWDVDRAGIRTSKVRRTEGHREGKMCSVRTSLASICRRTQWGEWWEKWKVLLWKAYCLGVFFIGATVRISEQPAAAAATAMCGHSWNAGAGAPLQNDPVKLCFNTVLGGSSARVWEQLLWPSPNLRESLSSPFT